MGSEIRIDAPDAAAAAALMHDVIGLLRAELVEDPGGWQVVIHPDRDLCRLAVSILDAVERWLEESGLPETAIRVDGRRYVLRAGARAEWDWRPQRPRVRR